MLRHRDFRNLFLGQSLSTLGDRIVFVALALSVTEIGSPTDGGLVLAAHGLPLVVPAFVLAGFGIALFGIWWETGSSARRAQGERGGHGDQHVACRRGQLPVALKKT